MASYLTSSTLIESIKRRASIPQSQSTFTEDDFLAFANEELSIGLLPSIMQFHEEFLVYTMDIPLLPNVQNYPIPPRAVGSKIRTAFYLDPQGNLRSVARVSPENAIFYQNSGIDTSYITFYLQNNEIVFVNKMGIAPTGSNLRVTYYLRPNQLVSESRCGVIAQINTETNTITLEDSVPSIFNNSGFQPLDLIERIGGHRTKAMDLIPLSTSDNTITFSSLPTNLAVGDHVALAGETMIPQIPDDLHSVLAQRVAARCLEALGDQNGLQAANVKLAEMEQKTGNLIDNRTEGQPQKIVNFKGLLRNARIRRRGIVNGSS